LGLYDYLIQRKFDGRIIYGGQRLAVPEHLNCNIWNDLEIDEGVGQALRKELTERFHLKIVPKPEESKLGQPLGHMECFIEDEWTGIMGFTPDELPIIGLWEDNQFGKKYILSAFCGTGMTLCFKAGLDIAKMIVNDEKTCQSNNLFNPHRFKKT